VEFVAQLVALLAMEGGACGPEAAGHFLGTVGAYSECLGELGGMDCQVTIAFQEVQSSTIVLMI
jgi:hypothetical protein